MARELSDGRIVAPGRLRVARMTRSLTQAGFARRMHWTQQYVQKCESGARSPIGQLELVADKLDFPTEFFLMPDIDPVDPAIISFRKRKSTTLTERIKIAGYGTLAACNLSPAIRSLVGLPPLSILDLSKFQDRPEVAAALLREAWSLGYGPIDNMIHLLEAKGAEVYFVREHTRTVDALCFWRGERAFVLLNTTKLDGGRARFDAAHELGHLVLHRGRDFAEMPNDEAEHQADRFASAFLLPERSFPLEAPSVFDLDAFAELRRRWKVSIQALVRRLYDLRHFTKWQYEDAYVKMSSLGYRSGPEPGAPSRESSYIHAWVIAALGDSGKGPDELARAANLYLDDLCLLMPEAEASMDGQRSAKQFFHEMRENHP